ncbi:MAG: deoxyribodipyrimidine photo-lyase [Nitrospira sp.]|nr:deoxyribodipyrimidine photo-lyase [Nitrospira sp.]
MRGLVWFRRDLRVHDNPALSAAVEECDEVVGLFVFDEPLLRSGIFGSACVNFMLGSLEHLASSLAGIGILLQWRRGEPVEEVIREAHDCKADLIYWNRDYEPRAKHRDRQVQQQMAGMGMSARTFKDHVVFEAEEVRGVTGEPLQRYSAYRTRWWVKWQTVKPVALPVPKPIKPTRPLSSQCMSTLPSANDLGYDVLTPWIEPGEHQALKRLRSFLNGPIHRYSDGRNLPASDGSSRLSPHFRFGTLSPRMAIHAALRTLAENGRGSRVDVLAWVDELIWREFFQQVLTAFPQVAEGPFRNAAIPRSRRPGPERYRFFQAWCSGHTGYPIVDAGMRQLNQTGWMHNRVRMVVASFLIKDLRIDWQSGERYFMHQLLDADVAANNGNWQWCASTGTDAMRGYRIFNPALQSKKFDPDGTYIRLYVPELASVPVNRIHEPHLMSPEEQDRYACHIGVDYPTPVVDHRQARQEYLNLGKQQVRR